MLMVPVSLHFVLPGLRLNKQNKCVNNEVLLHVIGAIKSLLAKNLTRYFSHFSYLTVPV